MQFRCREPACPPLDDVDAFACGLADDDFPACPTCGRPGTVFGSPDELAPPWVLDGSSAWLIVDAVATLGLELEEGTLVVVDLARSGRGLETTLTSRASLEVAGWPADAPGDRGWDWPPELEPARAGDPRSRVRFRWRRDHRTYVYSTGAVGDEVCLLGLDIGVAVRRDGESWAVEVETIERWDNT